MNFHPRFSALMATAFIITATPFVHAVASEIQLFPPVVEGTVDTTCPSGARAPLTWDGQTNVTCAEGVTIAGGNITIASGKLGVGTVDPASQLANNSTNRLDYTGNGLSTTAINWTASAPGYVAGFENLSAGNYFNGLLVKIADVSANSNILDLMSGGTSHFIVNGNGNVGINTTDPLTQLHVVEQSVAGNPGIIVEENAGIYSSPRIGFVDTSMGPDTVAPAWFVDNLHDRFRIFREPNAFTPGWEGMTVTNTGNVGIGALNPPYTLMVAPFDQSGGSAGLGVSWNKMTGGTGETDFYNYAGYGGGGFAFFNYENPGALGADNAYPTEGATNLMAILYNGNVGIGNEAPSYKLDVNGEARFTGNYTTSDRRLKTNIADIGYGLDDVMKLHPVFFDWKKPVKGEEGRRVGFIAQEVREVMPELVSIAPDAMKTEAVEYGNVTPVLVKAELKTENDNLQARVAADDAAVAADNAAIAAMKAKLGM